MVACPQKTVAINKVNDRMKLTSNVQWLDLD